MQRALSRDVDGAGAPSGEAFDHPHALAGPLPERLTAADVRALSRISNARALGAIVFEWSAIALVISVASQLDHLFSTLCAVILVGARQHALLILAHDASHFRLLTERQANDWVANVCLAWPMFVSVQGFRHYHGDHHRYLNQARDGNRQLWGTHGPDGTQTPEWRYPKTPAGFVLKLLRRVFMLTGVTWLLRGLVGGFMFGVTPAAHVVRVALLALTATVLTATHTWHGFFLYWVLPYCTWHIVVQYVRLACEHSAVNATDPRYADTRTTIVGWIGRALFLPCHVGYHLEHHWYPSVPFYRLPELHALLRQRPDFRAHAPCTRSLLESFRQLLT